MHNKTITASHYVLNDILLTLESGDIEGLQRVCQKYMSRYDNDDELVRVCNMVNTPKVGRKTIQDMKYMLEDLIDLRRLDNSGGTDLWFSDRRKVK